MTTKNYQRFTMKAKDGKEFEIEIAFVKGHGWDVNYNEFFRSSKKEAEQAAKSQLENKVFEYEVEAGLI